MALPADYEDFVERVYETALDPGLWPRVLKLFADMMGSSGAALRWCDAYTGLGTGANSGLDPGVGELYFGHFANRNPVRTPPEVMRRQLANWVPRIAVGEAWMTREDFVKTEYYNDFMRKFGLDWDLSIALDAEGDNVGFVNVFRSQCGGPHEAANLEMAAAVQPHLIRAFRLGRRFAASRGLGESLAEVIDGSPHGLFLLDAAGRVRHLNHAAERILARDDGLRLIGGRLTAASQDAARRLETMVGRAARGDAGGRVGGSMAVTTPERGLPLSLIVAPVRLEQAWLSLDGPSAVVCVTDLESGASLPQTRLRELFGLSPTESRVALALFEGLQPRQAAERLGLSFYTVRGHLARIFDKTQTSSQAELARLMMRTVGVWEGDPGAPIATAAPSPRDRV